MRQRIQRPGEGRSRSPPTASVLAVTVAAFVFSAVALALSLVGFGWELRKFALEGGRVKVQLRVGASNGAGVMSLPVAGAKPADLKDMTERGFPQLLVGVRVMNVGRGPVWIQGWEIENADGATYRTKVIGNDPLPLHLQGGQRAEWYFELAMVAMFISAASALKSMPPQPVWGVVELGTGEKIRTEDVYF